MASARQSWALSPIPTPPQHFPMGAFFSNMAHLFWNLPHNEDMLIYPWLLWFIWKARNYKVFSNDDHNPKDVMESALTEARAWAAAQTVGEIVHVDNSTHLGPVPSGEWCQVDGAWKETECRAGLGWYNFDPESDSTLVDCAQLVKMVSEPAEWPVFEILLEEMEKCRKMFQAFSITHIPRRKNTKADRLTQSARDQPHDVYNINSVPPVSFPEPI
ncbi:unnamed protein product [Microthlaspi erraticum]|uniref:RNase H type-1 domain-containing protein n=1 Tax=Microthlaspi erraticum TaxID=1685480 RepID=A0A6D2JCP9_9BRAS|nr:unnamed protein product [Microthlaspi erraticum]